MNVEPTGINATVTGAIRQAARMTGADFKYLLATAQVESNLNPNAQGATSSAKGLFQFIEQTWLATLKEQGPALGYAPYAEAITRLPSGQYAVSDPRMYRAVMNLRTDPTASALMAGAFTKANTAKLAEQLGRNPTEGELYIAHFLGPSGAGRLIALADSSPGTSAAAAFPGPARANPSIFFDRSGHARSVGSVYHALVGRYQVARGTPAGAPEAAVAAAAPEAPAPADPAGFAAAYAAAAPSPPVAAASGPIFNGLFRTTGAEEPVSPLVNSLWTTPPAVPTAPASSATAKPRPIGSDTAAPAPVRGEGLFQNRDPGIGALFRGRV